MEWIYSGFCRIDRNTCFGFAVIAGWIRILKLQIISDPDPEIQIQNRIRVDTKYLTEPHLKYTYQRVGPTCRRTLCRTPLTSIPRNWQLLLKNSNHFNKEGCWRFYGKVGSVSFGRHCVIRQTAENPVVR